MFPFHQRGLVSFQVTNDEDDQNPTNTSQPPYINLQKVEQDLSFSTSVVPLPPPPLHYHHRHLPNNTPNYVTARKGRPRRSSLTSEEVSNTIIKEDHHEYTQDVASNKKIVHREIERQRRQEMANLYSSLRTLLPIEYIKGKRSICDHIAEATKYIKDLEKNVKELGEKREKLKHALPSPVFEGISNVGSSSTSSSATTSKSDCSVCIHSFTSSIEIEINAPMIGDEDAFPLSRIIAVLIEEGLGIISCVSSKVNQRRIYVIHCEVNDGTSIDSNQLQWRLTSEVHSYDS